MCAASVTKTCDVSIDYIHSSLQLCTYLGLVHGRLSTSSLHVTPNRWLTFLDIHGCSSPALHSSLTEGTYTCVCVAFRLFSFHFQLFRPTTHVAPGRTISLSLTHSSIDMQLAQRSLTERWRVGDMSNFEYLMAINTLAHRRCVCACVCVCTCVCLCCVYVGIFGYV